MGFNFGSFASGFAKRDMEIRDEARREAKEIAATTLKYRAERAMEEEAERKRKIEEAKKYGMALKTKYKFNDDQILAVARTGQLKDMVGYYDSLMEVEGAILPNPNDIIQISGQKPKNKTFEEHLSAIVGGVPTEIDPRSLYSADDKTKSKGFLSDFFNPDFRESAFKDASEAFSGAFGMDIMQKYGESGEYADFAASIDVTPIQAQLTKSKSKTDGLTSSYINLTNKRVADVLAGSVFDVKSLFSSEGGFIGVDGQAQQKRMYWEVSNAATKKVEQYMRDDGVTFTEALSRVQSEIGRAASSSDTKEGQQAAVMRWANGEYVGASESSPTPEPAVTVFQTMQEGENWVEFMERIPDDVYNSPEVQEIVRSSDTDKVKADKIAEIMNQKANSSVKTTTVTEDPAVKKDETDIAVAIETERTNVEELLKDNSISSDEAEMYMLIYTLAKAKGINLNTPGAIRELLIDAKVPGAEDDANMIAGKLEAVHSYIRSGRAKKSSVDSVSTDSIQADLDAAIKQRGY